MKFLNMNASKWKVILDLKRLQAWITENCIKFAKMKNNFINFKGSHSKFALNDEELLQAANVKDLGVYICPDFS